MVVEALIYLTRIFVPFQGPRNAAGEVIVKSALFIRLFVLLTVPIFGWATASAFNNGPEPEVAWFCLGITLCFLAGIAAIWWPELRWSRDGLYVRSAFRRGRRYQWRDFNNISGTEESWALEMDDGIRFRGNKWTAGGAEFLEFMQNGRRFDPLDY